MIYKSKMIRLGIASFREVDWSKYTIKNWDFTKVLVPFRMMLHPIDMCNDIKYEGRGSFGLANLIVVLYFVCSIIRKQYFGFSFNQQQGEAFNVWPIFVQTIALLILWTITSWSLSTLLDGEGKVSEIWITTCYSMLPSVLFTIPIVLLSNVILLEEGPLVNMLSSAVNMWTFYILAMSTLVVQQYTVRKTLSLIFLTFVGIAAVVFIIIMFFSLFQQFFMFVDTALKEILFRM